MARTSNNENRKTNSGTRTGASSTRKTSSKKTVDAVYEEPKEVVEVVQKEEPKVVAPVSGGMSEMVKGMIVGSVVTAFISGIIILLLLAQNSDTKTSADLKEFNSYFEGKEYALIMFGSGSCGWCTLQKPIVDSIVEEHDLRYLYIDTELFEAADVEKIIEKLEIAGSTPASVVVRNGKVVKKWEGYADGRNYVANLVAAGMLPSGSIYSPESHITSVTFENYQELLKGSEISAIVFDAPGYNGVTDLREFLNTIAKEHDVPIYHLSANTIAEEDYSKYVEWLDEKFDLEKLQIPLLMFVRNGSLINSHDGFSASDKTKVTDLFKTNGLIK